ncbi:MAG TPA: hypothetical protein VID67_10900, partial [Rhizomicrobium sp.]
MKRKGATTSRPFSLGPCHPRLRRGAAEARCGATDGSPQAERDFKFYRQATNKIGEVSEEAGRFLE